jgi:hypothetical protein
MADISKCNDQHCPSKDYCYRFTAPTSDFRQSWGVFNREDDADNCDMFWSNNKCKYCNQTNGVHKMGCETRKITIILSIALLLLTSCGSRNVNKEVTKTDSISKTVAVVRTDSVSKDSTSIKFDVETEEIVIEAVDSTQPIEIINNDGKVTKYKNARISKKKRKDNTIVVNEKTVSKIVVDSLTNEIEVQKVQSAKIVYKEQFNYSTLILSFWWLYLIIAVVVFLIYRYKKL